MAWEWIGTTTVGLAGIAGTYFTSRRQSDVTVRLAREERVQARREKAYLQLQRTVERSMLWADATMPMMSSSGQDLYPAPPLNDDDVLDTSAQQIYWSKEVRALVITWTQARNQIATRSALARDDLGDKAESWRMIPELKQALTDAADELLAQMMTELMSV